MFIDKHQSILLQAPGNRTARLRIEINTRASRLILRIDDKAREAVAVAPHPNLADEAVRFATERSEWIADQLDSLPQPQPFRPETTIPFRGEATRLTLDGFGRQARLEPGPPAALVAPGASETFHMRIARFLKAQAKKELNAAVDRYCQTLNVDARRISVKDTRSRWGSCTSDGRLSFSWRLICAPPFVLDYVAAHECAHLLEMNHSDRFWRHVARCVGDPKAGRRWLRANGQALHALGVGSA